MIILHGLYGSSDNWIPIARSLSDRFEVYLPDQRNHGQSPHHPRHDYPSMRDDLSGFMDRHNLEKAILIGHSMGGKTVMHFAVTEPQRVEAMVVIDIAPHAYAGSNESTQGATHIRILDAMMGTEFEKAGTREDVDARLARSINSPKLRSFLMKNLERTDEGRYRWKLNIPAIRSELAGIFGGLDPGDFAGGKGVTGFPVLFIRGETSDYITDEMIPLIRTIFPVAELVTIPRAGHWLHVEQAGLLLKTLRYFLLDE